MPLASSSSLGTRSKKRHKEETSGDEDYAPRRKKSKKDSNKTTPAKGKRGRKPRDQSIQQRPQHRSVEPKPQHILLNLAETARKTRLFSELDNFEDKDLVPDLQPILDKIRVVQGHDWHEMRVYYGDLDELRKPSDRAGRAFFSAPKVSVLFRILEFTKMHVQMFSDCGGDFYTVWNQRERRYVSWPKVIMELLDDVIRQGECNVRVEQRKGDRIRRIDFKEWIRPGVWDLFRDVNKMVLDEDDEDEEGRYVFRWVCI